MSEISRSLHNSEPQKNTVGVVQREQEFPAIPEPKVNSGAPSPDVPGRTLNARPEWKATGNSAVFVCTCGEVTRWNELPIVSMLRGEKVFANCCNVGRANPFNAQRIERAIVQHSAVEVR